MTERDILSWTTLNAYVDGELEPDQTAKVAAALAHDREAAAQVATLTKLRAAVKAASPMPAPPPFALPRTRSRAMRWAPWAAAACLALFIGAASLGFGQREAQRMVDRVRADVGDAPRVEDVIRAALQQAPTPGFTGVRETRAVYQRLAA